MFADDLKLIANAHKFNDITADLKSLEEWEQLWSVTFNIDKCKVMHLVPNDNPGNSYILNGVVLDSVQSETDLGVSVSSDLKWDDHIKSSLSKANRMMAWVSRNVICKTKEVMSTIYRCLIRPHLEYCVQVWSPTPRHGNWDMILKIEKVQRKFTNLVNDVGTLQYSARLKALNLTTLAERRIRGDLIETFKIVRGLVNYGSGIFNVSRSGLNLVSKGLKVSNARKDFFGERVVKYWNVLPNYVKLSLNVDSFKANMELYKQTSLSDTYNVGDIGLGNFWEVSDHVLNRIEPPSSVLGRPAFCEYMMENPWVAKRRGINLFSS